MTFKSQEIVTQGQFSVIVKSGQVNTVLSKCLSKKQYTYIYITTRKWNPIPHGVGGHCCGGGGGCGGTTLKVEGELA